MAYQLPPLETLLEHARTSVDTLDTSTDNVAALSRDIQRAHSLVALCQSGERLLTDIARETGISPKTLSRWKTGRSLPDVLRRYTHSRAYLPTTQNERRLFAYMLGVYCYKNGGTDERSNPHLERVVGAQRMTRVVQRAVKTFCDEDVTIGTTSRGRQRIRVYDSQFVKRLSHSLTSAFDTFVSTDPERIAFLQGFFDTGKFSLHYHTRNKAYAYVINLHDAITLPCLVRSLFELDIYPYVSSEGRTLVLQGNHDLSRLHTLSLVFNPRERKKIKDSVPHNGVVTPYAYYTLRKKARALADSHHSVSPTALGHEFGFRRETVTKWICDILDPTLKAKTPHVVSRYEVLCDYLTVPNVFTTTQPVMRHRKLFIPVGHELYVVPHEAQETYYTSCALEPEPFDQETIDYVASELTKSIHGDSSRELDFTFDPYSHHVTRITPKLHGSRSRGNINVKERTFDVDEVDTFALFGVSF